MKIQKSKNKFYSIQAKDDSAEITIFDEIGFFGVTLKQFKADWDEIKNKKNISVLINSPGGDFYVSIAIYNLIVQKKENVTTEILGLAASGASIVFLAGENRLMRESTNFMIHNPYASVAGDGDKLRKVAGELDTFRDQLINIYSDNSELSKDEVRNKMEETTWYTDEQAFEIGFATEISKTEKIAAKFDLDKYEYAHVPKEILGNSDSIGSVTVGIKTVALSKPETIRDFEAHLRDLGYSRKESVAIASSGFSQRDTENELEQEETLVEKSVSNAILILTQE